MQYSRLNLPSRAREARQLEHAEEQRKKAIAEAVAQAEEACKEDVAKLKAQADEQIRQLEGKAREKMETCVDKVMRHILSS